MSEIDWNLTFKVAQDRSVQFIDAEETRGSLESLPFEVSKEGE